MLERGHTAGAMLIQDVIACSAIFGACLWAIGFTAREFGWLEWTTIALWVVSLALWFLAGEPQIGFACSLINMSLPYLPLWKSLLTKTTNEERFLTWGLILLSATLGAWFGHLRGKRNAVAYCARAIGLVSVTMILMFRLEWTAGTIGLAEIVGAMDIVGRALSVFARLFGAYIALWLYGEWLVTLRLVDRLFAVPKQSRPRPQPRPTPKSISS